MHIILTEKELREYVKNLINEYKCEKFYSMSNWLHEPIPYITEGLTMTYAPKKIKNILQRKYDLMSHKVDVIIDPRKPNKELEAHMIANDSRYNKTSDYDNWINMILCVKSGSDFDYEMFVDIDQTMQACGWYFSNIVLVDNVCHNITSVDKTTFEKIIGKTYNIIYSAKFDEQCSTENLPSVGYHICPLRVVDKILKQGLTPRNIVKSANHPPRVYIFIDDITHHWKNIAEIFKETQTNEPYCLLQVCINRDIKWYYDSNYNSNFGKAIWTWEPIAPNFIKVIDKEQI